MFCFCSPGSFATLNGMLLSNPDRILDLLRMVVAAITDESRPRRLVSVVSVVPSLTLNRHLERLLRTVFSCDIIDRLCLITDEVTTSGPLSYFGTVELTIFQPLYFSNGLLNCRKSLIGIILPDCAMIAQLTVRRFGQSAHGYSSELQLLIRSGKCITTNKCILNWKPFA